MNTDAQARLLAQAAVEIKRARAALGRQRRPDPNDVRLVDAMDRELTLARLRHARDVASKVK